MPAQDRPDGETLSLLRRFNGGDSVRRRRTACRSRRNFRRQYHSMRMSKAVCAACQHKIDQTAKLCPYCGANPVTGERVLDTQAILEEVFHPRQISTTESVLE